MSNDTKCVSAVFITPNNSIKNEGLFLVFRQAIIFSLEFYLLDATSSETEAISRSSDKTNK